jgi:hypothetical protein
VKETEWHKNKGRMNDKKMHKGEKIETNGKNKEERRLQYRKTYKRKKIESN